MMVGCYGGLLGLIGIVSKSTTEIPINEAVKHQKQIRNIISCASHLHLSIIDGVMTQLIPSGN